MGQNLYFTHVGDARLPLDDRGLLRDLPHGVHAASGGPLLRTTAARTTPSTRKADICSKCHSSITARFGPGSGRAQAGDAQGPRSRPRIEKRHESRSSRAGNAIDIGTAPNVTSDPERLRDRLGRVHREPRPPGRHVTLANGTKVADVALNNVKVVPSGGRRRSSFYAVADPALAKAGWNYCDGAQRQEQGRPQPGVRQLRSRRRAVRRPRRQHRRHDPGLGTAPASAAAPATAPAPSPARPRTSTGPRSPRTSPAPTAASGGPTWSPATSAPRRRQPASSSSISTTATSRAPARSSVARSEGVRRHRRSPSAAPTPRARSRSAPISRSSSPAASSTRRRPERSDSTSTATSPTSATRPARRSASSACARRPASSAPTSA